MTRPAVKSQKLQDMLALADEKGLLTGKRKKVIRGRMPEALVKQAKKRTGLKSDTELIQVALANLAVEDDFVEYLLSQRGTIPRNIDLEF